MIMGVTKCPHCGEEFKSTLASCPQCEKRKGIPVKEMEFDSMGEIGEAITDNVREYQKEIVKRDKLQDLLEDKDKDMFDFQRNFVEKFLIRFPQIKDRIRENEDIELYLFIISIPYMNDEKEYQHECILQRISEEQNGIVNLSLNIEEISTNLYSIELPIWTDDFSERNVNRQYEMLKERIPRSQKIFIHSVEPWYYLNRIYEFEGQWIDWKTVLEIPPDKLRAFVDTEGSVPVNFQNFSSLRYSNITTTAGTASDGEAIFGTIGEDEYEYFLGKYEELKSLYRKGSPLGLELIEISWDILKELGFLYESVSRILRSKKHIFSKTLADLVLNISEEELARFTQSVNFRKKCDKEVLSEVIVDSILNRMHKKYDSGTIGVHEPIERTIREQYRIAGDAV
jgi:hypothetical protein